jgi:biotin synthase
MDAAIARLGTEALEGRRLERAALVELADRGQRTPMDLLYWANRVRERWKGRRVSLCCIVAGKLGSCAEDCRWCAQSGKSAPGVTAPRRTPQAELVQTARRARDCGAGHIGVVNSGRRPSGEDLRLVAQAIGPMGECGIDVCASLGELSAEQATQLAAAGVRRYHHNLETSREFFARMVTTHTYDDRLATLKRAREAGMELCCGGLLGMGESWADRVELALTIRDEVSAACVPLNFLHPIPGTALEHAQPPAPMECLCIIAMFRLAMPAADIKVAGGREANLRDLQSWVFFAGASSLMTGDYLTTKGRGADADLRMIRDLGMSACD